MKFLGANVVQLAFLASAGAWLGSCGGSGGPSGGTPQMDADPLTPAGMCDNEADKAGLQATYGEMNLEISGVAAACAKEECLLAADFQACVHMCLITRVMGGVSETCLGCVAGSTACAATNCLSKCLSDPSSAECLACQCGMNAAGINCRQQFQDCAGVTRNTCEPMGS
jgi:hypothetical protein